MHPVARFGAQRGGDAGGVGRAPAAAAAAAAKPAGRKRREETQAGVRRGFFGGDGERAPQLRRTRQKEPPPPRRRTSASEAGGGGGGVGSGEEVRAAGATPPPPAAGTKAEPKAAAAKAAVAKPQHKSPPKHAAKVSPPAAAAAAAASAGAGGKKKGGSTVFAPHNPGTPLGKGRKLCLECNGVVGSPTRVCPHCNATLPFKQHTANSPKGAAAKNAAAAAKRRASAEGDGGGASEGARGGVGGGGGGGGVGASSSVAQFLGRHRERFVSCKVSQLRRNVQEVCEGVRAVLDAGRVQDPGAAKHLREMSKKVGEVRLLQGVVERPRAREVMGLIEAAVRCATDTACERRARPLAFARDDRRANGIEHLCTFVTFEGALRIFLTGTTYIQLAS